MRPPRSILILVAVVIVPLVGMASAVHASAAQDALCVADPQAAGCGDGICDPYMGENAQTCPQDCATPSPPPPATATQPPPGAPTSAPTSTPTATSALTSTPTFTPTLTATGTPPPSPTPGGPPTKTPAPSPTTTPAPPAEGAGIGQCRYERYEAMPYLWRVGYDQFAPQSYKFPTRLDEREVLICDTPPAFRLCLPILEGVMRAAQGREEWVVLVDCGDSETCRVVEGAQLSDDQFCFDITPEDQITCASGCALGIRPRGTFARLLGPELASSQALIPLCGLLALLGLLVLLLLILLMARRRRTEQEEQTEGDLWQGQSSGG